MTEILYYMVLSPGWGWGGGGGGGGGILQYISLHVY